MTNVSIVGETDLKETDSGETHIDNTSSDKTDIGPWRKNIEQRREREEREDRMNRQNDPPRRKNRILRSRDDAVICGVCGGIAQYFDFSPWGVRFAFILFTMISGFWPGIAAYVICSFVMQPAPARPFTDDSSEEFYVVSQTSRTEALHKVQRAFQQLDKRLQRMEAIVTQPGFGLESEIEDL